MIVVVEFQARFQGQSGDEYDEVGEVRDREIDDVSLGSRVGANGYKLEYVCCSVPWLL